MTEPTADALGYRPAVIGTSRAGDTWVGTDHWLVLDDQPRQPDTATIDVLVGQDFNLPLERLSHGMFPLTADTFYGVLRPYLRPDGITIWLLDVEVAAVEKRRETDDEEGNTVQPDLQPRQGNNRYRPVGFYDGEQLVALVVPVKMINDHLHDGTGADLPEAQAS